MIAVSGDLFEAGKAASRPAVLRRLGQRLLLSPPDERTKEEAVGLGRVSSRIAGVPRRLQLLDGRTLVTRDDEAVDALLTALGRRPSGIFRWERLTLRRVAILLALLVVGGAMVRALVPWIADGVARTVPESAERWIGRSAFAQLEYLALEESKLPQERRDSIVAAFRRLADQTDLSYVPALRFVGRRVIGANAIAFPGGPIVVGDGMVDLAQGNEELAGILAHELAHVEARHGLRKVLRYSGWALLATATFGDTGTLIDQVAALAAVGATQGYSRDFEAEADLRGLEILRGAGFPAEPYLAIMERLRRECGAPCEDEGFWASHPPMRERLDALGTAARGTGPAE